MRFKQYLEYIKKQYHPLNKFAEKIQLHSIDYIEVVIQQLLTSMGKHRESIVYKEESGLTIEYQDKKIIINITPRCEYGNNFIYLDNSINELDSIQSRIHPDYFKKKNIQNYLREFEIQVKQELAKVINS